MPHSAKAPATSWLEPAAAVLGIAAVAVIGGMITAPVVQSEWYQSLQQPAFAPPRWLFSPVWTTLYTLMCLAYILVWRTGSRESGWRAAFAVQAVLNLAWSAVFFGMNSPVGGLVVISLLLVAIMVNLGAFWSRSRAAGIMLVPYLLWVTFAAILNASIVSLN